MQIIYRSLTDFGLSAVMMLVGFLFLLLLADGEPSECNSSYVDIVKQLKLTKDRELFALTRPVKDHKKPTIVTLDVLLYAILDVKEKEQKLISYLWIDMWWQNDHISWKPEEFCDIKNFSLPADVLWKPDVTIEEMLERERNPHNPYLIVESDGSIEFTNDQVLVSTCRMHVYKFPFDIQVCNITFKSTIHSDRELKLIEYLNSSKTTKRSLELMGTQYEWLFIKMTVLNQTVNHFGFVQSLIIYTISIKRRSGLYIVNFLLPVLFFLGLDLASFLISDSGGEKLSFKVTVLLAVTVLQLILNEILPASSDRIPLVAVYCIGIFGLMLLSLLETIVVMYLMKKDFTSHDNEAVTDQSLRKDCVNKRGRVRARTCFKEATKYIRCACDWSRGETPSELLRVADQGHNGQLTDASHDFERVSGELREMVKALAVLVKKKNKRHGHWKRVTLKINRAFFVFYVMAASLFLVYMYLSWTEEIVIK